VTLIENVSQSSRLNMRKWSIPAGRIFGVQVRVHLTFFILLLFVWLTEALQTGWIGVARGFALVAIVFGSVVVHELAHALVALRNGINVRAIMLLPIGGVTLMDEETYRNPNPSRDMRIAAAGPLVNIVLAVFFGSATLLLWPEANLFGRPFVHSANLVRSLFWSNLFLGLFNLLPAYPLDGGRVLRAWFTRRMDSVHATRRAVSIGQFFAILMIAAGVWNTWLMLIGFILFLGGQVEDRSALFQAVLEQVRIEDVMLTDFLTLSPADTLEDALQKAVHSLQDDFPVVRDNDMVGTITRQKIMESVRSGEVGYVQGAMNRIFQVAGRKDTVASVLRKASQNGMSLITVVDGGHMVGIVTLQNLSHSIALLAESRKLRQAN